jgi:hypothetical protein
MKFANFSFILFDHKSNACFTLYFVEHITTISEIMTKTNGASGIVINVKHGVNRSANLVSDVMLG